MSSQRWSAFSTRRAPARPVCWCSAVPPGIGKTTLLDAAWHAASDFDRARIAGLEAEADLAWAGRREPAARLAGSRGAGGRAAARGRRRRPPQHGGGRLGAARGDHPPQRDAARAAGDRRRAVARSRRRPRRSRSRRIASRPIAWRCSSRSAPIPRRASRARRSSPSTDSSAPQCRALVRSRWSLPADVVDRCIELTGGNPLALAARVRVAHARSAQRATADRRGRCAARAAPRRSSARSSPRLPARDACARSR